MSIKKFIVKTVVKILIFACLMVIASSIVQSPIITNEIALGQMQNYNESFILMDTYSRLRPAIGAICAGITLLFTCNIACDTYKFVKTIKNKNEKEKN